jgi:hypothetical protein
MISRLPAGISIALRIELPESRWWVLASRLKSQARDPTASTFTTTTRDGELHRAATRRRAVHRLNTIGTGGIQERRFALVEPEPSTPTGDHACFARRRRSSSEPSADALDRRPLQARGRRGGDASFPWKVGPQA